MAEETREEDLCQKETYTNPNGQRDINLGKHVTKSGKHHHQEPREDATWQQPWKLKREYQRYKIDSERQNPEQRGWPRC